MGQAWVKFLCIGVIETQQEVWNAILCVRFRGILDILLFSSMKYWTQYD